MLMAIPSIGALHCTAPLYILPNTFGLRLFLLYQAPLSPSWVIHWHNQWIPILLFSLHDFFFFYNTKTSVLLFCVDYTWYLHYHKTLCAIYLQAYFQSTMVKIYFLCPYKNPVPFHMEVWEVHWICSQGKIIVCLFVSIPRLLIW